MWKRGSDQLEKSSDIKFKQPLQTFSTVHQADLLNSWKTYASVLV